eukprot:jgi/Galph1/3905/GphlegSOOS_G2549.1
MAGNTGRVKNKAPAPVQITAEQLLREAWERREPEQPKAPKQRVQDEGELMEVRQRRRKEFEDKIRMNRTHIPTWIKYAKWEAAQLEFSRARSIYERALDIDYTNPHLWVSYAEMEMKNKFINHARNIWDRAVALLPRVAQLWFKYAYMEEMLGNIPGCRAIFERWMKWVPDDKAWNSYVRFELRYGQIEKARDIFERFVIAHPVPRTYIRYARFEERQHERALSRKIFERGLQEAPSDHEEYIELLLQFAVFEERCGEVERARMIYKYALEKSPENRKDEIHALYNAFERQRGGKVAIEESILKQKREEYESILQQDPYDYDTWFDYCLLEEEFSGDPETIRHVFSRAISHKPPNQKRFWKRYIYLWIYYAVWEELTMHDLDKTCEVYNAALNSIPNRHKDFSFKKLWILLAKLHIRRKDLASARKLLGTAIGMLKNNEKIFKEYIALELALGEIERSRILYQKWIEQHPYSSKAWLEFANLEISLNEADRARAIYDLAVEQTELDAPELVWKAYIDMEIDEGEYEHVRSLYERLLERSQHVKVWLSYANFERTYNQDRVDMTREIYRRADRSLANAIVDLTARSRSQASDDQVDPELLAAKEDRATLLREWLKFEQEVVETEGSLLKELEVKQPQKVKRRRPVYDSFGENIGWEEYYDFLFPEEAESGKAPSLKILQMAHQWKKQKVVESNS